MTELEASRWLEKQIGMTCTTMENGRMVLFTQGILLVEGKGILGAVIEAKKVLDKLQEPQPMRCG